MSGAFSRSKGRAFEQHIASALRAIWPDLKREWQFRGPERPDLDGRGCPYYFECKATEGGSIWAAMRQASRDSKGRPPVVIAKRNHEGTVVVMRLTDWILLVGNAEAGRPK